MDKKQIFTLAVVTLTTLGLSAGAIYEAQNRQAHTSAVVVRAESQRQAAIAETAQHDRQAKLTVDSLTAQNQSLVVVKSILCAQLKSVHQVNPRCP